MDGSAGTLQPGDMESGDGLADGLSGSRLRLPIGAVLLALLQVAEGAWLLAAIGGVSAAVQSGLPAELLTYGIPGQYAVTVVAVLRFAVAVGLVLRIPAAWLLAMLVTGGGLAATLSGYALGHPDDIRLLLDVASAFYLNQPGVRAIFGRLGERPDDR